MVEKAGETETAVFKIHIKGSVNDVWREITKTHEVQKAMFDSQLHTDGLVPGGVVCMRSADGKYTAVVGKILQIEEPRIFSQTFRFTTYDDPECIITYELESVDGGVDFTLTCTNMAVGTKSTKQMKQGGNHIVKTLKAVVETGKPSFGVRMLYGMFKLLGPLMSPKKALSENWPLPS